MDFLILNPQSQVTLAGGAFNVVGNRASAETIILLEPPQGSLTLTFDPSFNSGSDTIAFIGNAEDYSIRLSGSSVIITSGTITATIPVGLNDTNIVFIGDGPLEEGDLRVLRADPPVDGNPPVIALGDQVIEPGAPAQTITPLDDTFAFTGSFSTSVAENQSLAFDADLVGDPDAVFALTGEDRELFEIDEQTGVVTFITPPDFEVPADADGDNVYNVRVFASITGETISQDVSITVTDVEDPAPDPGAPVVRITTGLRDAVAPTATQENDAGRLNAAGDIVTAFGIAPAVTGRVGVDTEIQNLGPNSRIVLTGESQTVGEGNNNTDQRFGEIVLEDAEPENLVVELENTARVSGQLTVDRLVISESEDPDAGEGSQVETLTIESTGERETVNAIRELLAPEVGNLVLTGSQGLGVVVETFAARTDLDLSITGADLGGPLTLGINGSELDGGDDDVIIGTDSTEDRLVFYGELGEDTDTTVDDFENLQFGTVRPSAFGDATQSPARSVEGEFSLSNVTGDNNIYTITNLSGALTLTDLSGDTTVNVGDGTAGEDSPEIQFDPGVNEALIFEGADDDDAITVNLTPWIGEFSGLLTAGFPDLLDSSPPTEDFIAIDGFEEVTLNVSRQADTGDDFSFPVIDLRLDGATGIDLDAGGLTLDGAAALFRTDAGGDFDAVEVDEVLDRLTITGGATNREDQMDIGNAILGSIGVIDISGYHGTFFAEVVNAVRVEGSTVESANVDRTFIIGDDDVFITLQRFDNAGPDNAEVIDTNTTFRFTDGTPTSGDIDGTATWVIDNFVFADPDGSSIVNAGLSNFSVLDFSGLGLTSFTQLEITQEGSDAVITADGADWEIILTDTDIDELTADSENFVFASGTGEAQAQDVAMAPALEPTMGMMESFAYA